METAQLRIYRKLHILTANFQIKDYCVNRADKTKQELERYCSVCFNSSGFLNMCFTMLSIFSFFLIFTTGLMLMFPMKRRAAQSKGPVSGNFLVFFMFFLWQAALIFYFVGAFFNYEYGLEKLAFSLPLAFAFAIFGYCIYGV